ncbi:MAG TPA: carboxypeptidase-like regulatory domain-containing protein, partial [Gemmatimonadaceae bacterium]|nr:carboxypeptidase-like regulatory domain-containing protein [Gemmatimonadaceae bacterium]
MMKNSVILLLMGMAVAATQAAAQEKTVTGRVTNEQDIPISGVVVIVRGTNRGNQTNGEGRYLIRVESGQVLLYRLIGYAPEERTVDAGDVINVQLRKVLTRLDEVVVTALGQTTERRALGTAEQTVTGAEIAQSQRTNFVNALQGRIAGVEVTSTSGVPGASSLITIRGTSSISSSNQP